MAEERVSVLPRQCEVYVPTTPWQVFVTVGCGGVKQGEGLTDMVVFQLSCLEKHHLDAN